MTMLPFKPNYIKNSLANILSFPAVACRSSITIDTDIDSAINTHIDNDTNIKFKQCSRGLYYYDTTDILNKTANNQVTDHTFIDTVESNTEYSTDVKSRDQTQKEYSKNL